MNRQNERHSRENPRDARNARRGDAGNGKKHKAGQAARRAAGRNGRRDETERETRRASAKRQREAEVRRQKQRLVLIAAAAVAVLVIAAAARGAMVRRNAAGSGQAGTPNTGGAASSGTESAAERQTISGSGTGAGAAVSASTDNVGSASAASSGGTETAENVSPAGTDGSFTISAVGDCTLGTDENFDPDTSFVAKYNEVDDPAYFFSGVKSVLAADDLTIANLEGTLTTADDRADKTFAFKGDPSYTAILTDGSVEAVNLANNHSHDYGEQSYEDTIANVTDAGIISFGYDRTSVVEVNGIRVGLTGTYCLRDREEALQSMQASIQKVKDEGAQVIISSFHWGIEKEYVPDEDQIAIAHAAVDAGANLVLGHHPHVLQGIENYNGVQIVYSLGNFCFGGNQNPSDKDTMIYQQTFTVKNGKLAEDANVNSIPCSLSSSDSYNDYRPVILTGSRKTEVEQKIEAYSEEIPG